MTKHLRAEKKYIPLVTPDVNNVLVVYSWS